MCKAPCSIALGMLLIHAGLLAWSDWCHSPTFDEVGHLPAGIAVWRYGRFDLYSVNPPLVRAVAAVPVVLADPETDWSQFTAAPSTRPEWAVGTDFIKANGKRSFWLFTLARWACIPFSLLGGWICWRWTRELYGNAAGFVALALWCFSPNVLGNGSLITPDVAAASCGLLAAWSFSRWLQRPDWDTVLAAGIAFGLAELAKMTWLILFALWPMIWLMVRVRRSAVITLAHREPIIPPPVAQLAAILLLGLYLLNLGYAFDGSFRPLGEYEFVSTALGGEERDDDGEVATGNRFADTWFASLLVPLPRDYLLGLDLQKYDFEQGKMSYLRGEFKHGGWWYYYLYAAAVKMPIGTWLLVAIALTLMLIGQPRHVSEERPTRTGLSRAEWLPLLIPPLAVFVLVSAHTGFNRYFRYVLPALPFLFVWVGQAAQLWTRERYPPGRAFWRRIGGAAVAATLAWSVASSLWHYPHNLSYFNEAVGGPRHGHEHLINANIDWGQDLFFLKEWIDAHPEARPLTVAYWGLFNERIAGIDFPRTPAAPPRELATRRFSPGSPGPQPGWHALSVNLLRHETPGYDYFLEFQPSAYAGFSIHIYHLTPEQAETARRRVATD